MVACAMMGDMSVVSFRGLVPVTGMNYMRKNFVGALSSDVWEDFFVFCFFHK